MEIIRRDSQLHGFSENCKIIFTKITVKTISVVVVSGVLLFPGHNDELGPKKIQKCTILEQLKMIMDLVSNVIFIVLEEMCNFCQRKI